MSLTNRTRAGITAAAVAGALALTTAVGVTVANADDTVTPDATESGSTITPDAGARPQHIAEEELTGATADSVRAAVLTTYPDATIDRMEKDSDGQGVYEAHITKADGSHVTVYLDESFAITGESEGGPGGPGGPGDHGPRGTEVTGDAADQVTAAATAAVAGMTVDHVVQLPDGSYLALGHKADGSRVAVKVGADFTGATVQEMPERGMRGPGGPGATDVQQLSGATADKVRKAAKKRYPNATVDMLVKTPDGSYAALMTKADGSRVVVDVNKRFAVSGTHTPRMHGGPHAAGADAATDGTATSTATTGTADVSAA